jgi:hypothetical protein
MLLKPTAPVIVRLRNRVSVGVVVVRLVSPVSFIEGRDQPNG